MRQKTALMPAKKTKCFLFIRQWAIPTILFGYQPARVFAFGSRRDGHEKVVVETDRTG
jgi:hypothetical protein